MAKETTLTDKEQRRAAKAAALEATATPTAAVTVSNNDLSPSEDTSLSFAGNAAAADAEQEKKDKAEKDKGFNLDFGKILDSIFEFIGNLFGAMFQKWASKYTVASRAANDVKGAMKSTFGEVKGVVSELLSSVTNAFQVMAEEALETFTEQFSKSNTGRVLNTLAGLSTVGSSLMGFFTGAEVQPVATATSAAKPTARAAFSDRVGSRLNPVAVATAGSHVAKEDERRAASPVAGAAASV
jgi:hypothetical protein